MQLLAPTALVLARGAGHSTGGTQSQTVQVVAGAILVAVGLLNLFKPDVAWTMSKWQYRNPSALQPSAARLVLTRVVGVLAVIAGVALVVEALH